MSGSPVRALFLLLLSSWCAQSGTLVQFRTSVGSFDVELYDSDKPVTVQNFIRYVTNGLYTDMVMHRVVTNFVIQGGGYYLANRGATNAALQPISTFSPITNEFRHGNFHSNVYGTIAMAKTTDPNSATCQFFFNLTNNAKALDNTNNSGGFTVFGHVISGTNSLNAFKIGPTNRLVKKVNLGIPFTEFPVRYTATNIIQQTDLIYVDISLVTLEMKVNPDASRQISWNSVSNKINYVEFATHVQSAAWQLLFSTNGNGNKLTVIDNSPQADARFYRVRIGY